MKELFYEFINPEGFYAFNKTGDYNYDSFI